VATHFAGAFLDTINTSATTVPTVGLSAGIPSLAAFEKNRFDL
jgi:hypothetical protein